jgi:hypothetical protein
MTPQNLSPYFSQKLQKRPPFPSLFLPESENEVIIHSILSF